MTNLLHPGEVMADKKHGHVRLSGDFLKGVKCEVLIAFIQTGYGFVSNQEFWFLQKYPDYRKALSFTTGVIARQTV